MINAKDIQSAKARGFLINRGTDCFSGRIVTAGGVYTAQQLREIADLAERYGNGKAIVTSRQCVELPGMALDSIEAAQALAKERIGLEFGGTGAKVRPVTACKGTTCVYGNTDTQALAWEIHQRFYVGMRDVALPHKFKIGVGGCPNSCMKPSLNDLGIEAHRAPVFDAEKCRACKVCVVETSCPSGAVSRQEGAAPEIQSAQCRTCGVCGRKCPFGAMTAQDPAQFLVTVGGTWGKTRMEGKPLSRMYAREELMDVIQGVLLWFRENAYQKERLAKAIERVGLDKLQADLDSGALLARSAEILAAPIKTR